MAAIVAASPEVVASWSAILSNASAGQKRTLHLFAIQFARSIAPGDPVAAASLFQQFSEVDPLVRHVVGMSKVPVVAIAAWVNADIPEFRTLCFDRLDHARSDKDIAMDVLAAFKAGMESAIVEYVDRTLATNEPAQICRALMVAGFSDENHHASSVLAKFAGAQGFIGAAQKAAQYAYERNTWAKHWYMQMAATDDRQEFWRASVLFSKLVDGRFDGWHPLAQTATETFLRFFPTVEENAKRRIKKWQDSRRDKLFGEKAPDAVFLPH